MSIAFIVFVAVFVVTFCIRMPIAIGMMAACVFYFMIEPGPATTIEMVTTQFVSQLHVKFVMIAIPLFIFAARVMNEGGVTDLIFNWALTLVGRFKGGMGHVNVVASLIFSGMSGAATADAAGLGLMEIRAMQKRGYDDGFACAITAASATIGPIFPPSIPMILYATLSGASVGSLFLGGIVPGVLLALFLMAYVVYIAHRRNYPKETVKITVVQWVLMTLKALPALITPVILLTGIYGGVFTPTEGGAIAAVWAVFVGMVIYRNMGLRRLWVVLVESAEMTAIVAVKIGAAFAFSFIISYEQVSQHLTALLLDFSSSKLMLLLLVNLAFLALGMIIDTMVLLIVFVPLVIPMANAFGIDLVHFGVVLILNMMIGLSTPPVGGLLFITSAVSGVPLHKIIKEIIPIVGVMIVVLVLVTFIPELVLFIPSMSAN
ncbi:TRAP transporter large permease [Oceaniglobus trochenteri]|uniref:TRAP transporter large permease n=1 Tax=Oceaniglobus trochenteri TaxID=2763260 RepID=UPI001CFFD037